MRGILEVAAKVGGLGGLAVAFSFFIFRQIIAKNIFPKLTQSAGGEVITKIIDSVYKVALAAMFFGFLAFVVSKATPEPRLPIEPSLTVNLPNDLSVKNAVVMIVEDDHATANFLSSCKDAFLATKIKGGIVSARTTADLIEQLNYRRINPRVNLVVHARKDDQRGIYEIDCIK